ncbi:MAG TPA: IS3 family transposase [Thermodesulfobacteriota bacterium]|nr:IS3 family transposase [Thermodesulfobacteriota bacterium]HNU71322.1 IS3 family transposase [Thermodesulfobacteriota bacterium]
MKYQFIDTHRSLFAVEKMCHALSVTKSGYYAWRSRPQGSRAAENQLLDTHIQTVFTKNKGTYGSPRISHALRQQHLCCSENRVARRMRLLGLRAKTKRRFKVTTNSQHAEPRAANVLRQHFTAQRPNQVWVSDITYIWTREGWLYLAVILDLFSRRIVGWALQRHLGSALVLSALKQALWQRRPSSGLIFHSDQGIQYACAAFRSALAAQGIIQSMSGKGNCYDNAVAESFFHSLKTEAVYSETFTTREQAQQSLFEYMELYYNRQRLHSTLNYCCPVQFEQRWLSAAAA